MSEEGRCSSDQGGQESLRTDTKEVVTAGQKGELTAAAQRRSPEGWSRMVQRAAAKSNGWSRMVQRAAATAESEGSMLSKNRKNDYVRGT